MTPEPAGSLALERTVVFLGDSITAGYELPIEQAYPSVLSRLLGAEGTRFALVNAGQSGDTSGGGVSRLSWVLRAKPAVLVLELGGNDGLRGAPVADIERNLREIVRTSQRAGAAVLLLGVRLPDSQGVDYARDFNAIYPRVATDLQLAFVPDFLAGVAGDPRLNLADGLHPTPEGHERIARTVLPALRGLLQQEKPVAQRAP